MGKNGKRGDTMRKKLGLVCMILGIVLLLGAAALLVYNRNEATQAEAAVREVLPVLLEKIEKEKEEAPEVPTHDVPQELLTPEDLVMGEMEIDGHSYIGFLSIPALELELPVMSDWSYPQLKIAPCRYSGTIKGGDLVLMAHNYARHFGGLSQLTEGEPVFFTDAGGRVYQYQVAAVGVLPPTAVEEMTAGEFDLTLFTCTYGGSNRVTVYCDKE